MPRPHPQGERVWLHKPDFLGLAEVLKPCNCRCKNAKCYVLKHESHHIVRAIAVAESRTCVPCSICKTSVSVKQRRKLNPCRPENEEVRRFFADFVDPSFKRIPPDADYYVCQKDFQQLGKALNACNSYQAIVREMKLGIGVVIDVSTEGVDDSMSERDMSIGGGTESSSLSGISKLPKGKASPLIFLVTGLRHFLAALWRGLFRGLQQLLLQVEDILTLTLSPKKVKEEVGIGKYTKGGSQEQWRVQRLDYRLRYKT